MQLKTTLASIIDLISITVLINQKMFAFDMYIFFASLHDCIYLPLFRASVPQKIINEDKFIGKSNDGTTDSIRQYRRRMQTESGTQDVRSANVEGLDRETASSTTNKK